MYTEDFLINIINNIGRSVEDLRTYDSSPKLWTTYFGLYHELSVNTKQCIPPYSIHLQTPNTYPGNTCWKAALWDPCR